MISFIGDLFGIIMYWCYRLVHNYGLAIILFTLITKVILFPLAVVVQKNSIKMVKMYPEINRVKAKYYGSKDIISEEQYNLYKKYSYNPFLDLIPLFIQLIFLMGVVDVIYKPLRHILRIDEATVDILLDKFVSLTGVNPQSGSLQVQLVSWINNGNKDLFLNSCGNVGDSILNSVGDLNLTFLGFDFGVIPVAALGISLIIPAIAAISAWLMCFTQNMSNVLQAEQSKGNKLFTMLLSVGLSLYLGLFVPAGVGFYWILGNIFSILQMYFLNWIINPKKYIDYEALEESRKELQKMTDKMKVQSKERTKEEIEREKSDYKRFEKYGSKQLVVYSEKNGFYKYYRDIIKYILEKTDIVVHYITSDYFDEVMKMENDSFRVYYMSDNKLIPTMMKMDADIVLMTTPDLQKYHLKRSIIRKDVEYIYIDHAINSFNMMLRPHAVDYFDTIFAANEIICDEIRAMEKLYNLPEKKLVKYGYCLIDNMIKAYESEENIENSKKTVLIAPSWHNGNIMESCIEDILDNLKNSDYQIIVRPHPQFVRHNEARIVELKSKYADDSNIDIQTDFSANSTVFNAAALISDWSGIAYEYSFTTLRPTIYINTPMKVMNENYRDIDVEPFDLLVRSKMGYSIDLENITSVGTIVDKVIEGKEFDEDTMIELRNKYLFNIGKSAKVAGNYIIKQIIEKSNKSSK